MKLKASDYIAHFLAKNDVRYVFELAGGMITHMLDSIAQTGEVEIVSMQHEQSAAFAAEAVGRMRGKPCVALATSGPGATNLLTGIGSCYFDSTPAIFITGQVNTFELKGDRPIRQLGFQETDVVSMAKPITKAAYAIKSAEELVRVLPEAFKIATSGRPGPVLIDIPMDVQRKLVEVEDIPIVIASSPPTSRSFINPVEELELIINGLRESARPLILVGGGLSCVREWGKFEKFVSAANVPVVSTLMAVDALPYDHPCRVGFIGSYGNRWANLAIGRADFMLVLGSRLDIRQTGADTEGFAAGKKIVHVDIEAGEINNRVKNCVPIHQCLSSVLEWMEIISTAPKDNILKINFPSYVDWHSELSELRAKWPDTNELQGIAGINPNSFMHDLSRASIKAAAFIADVGNHQMWAAQSLELRTGQRFLTSGGMGAMGYALPSAIGASLGAGRLPVVVIAGDGGFQINIQDLEAVRRNNLPLKMVVMNNGCLGMIRQFQDSYFDSRYQSTMWGYSAPDFKAVAEAYKIPGLTISSPKEITAALKWLWNDPKSPALLQVMIDPKANAYPKIAFGKPITEMEPFSKPLDMEGT